MAHVVWFPGLLRSRPDLKALQKWPAAPVKPGRDTGLHDGSGRTQRDRCAGPTSGGGTGENDQDILPSTNLAASELLAVQDFRGYLDERTPFCELAGRPFHGLCGGDCSIAYHEQETRGVRGGREQRCASHSERRSLRSTLGVFSVKERCLRWWSRVFPQIERKASVHEVCATDDESGDAEAMDLLCRRRFSMRSSLRRLHVNLRHPEITS